MTPCETCGKETREMTWCNDALFCSDCWKDFGTERWKGLGSRMATPEPCASKEEP